MEIGLYVAVSNLDDSKDFYSKLFNKGPYVETLNFVGFEISGGRFGLYLESAYSFPLQRGNSTVPNLRVEEI
jgi:hypothetical protein